MTEHADYLARMAEDWTRNPFVAISNEGATGQEFLGHLKAVLAEHDAVLADNERLEQQHLADASRWTQETGEMRDRAREMLDRSEWLEDQVCRETQRLDAENASLRREHEGLLWLIEETANLAEQAADERDQARADNERLTAQVAEVGFRLGETAAELADTRAKLAAASRAVAATDGRDRATYWRGWDDCVTAVKGQLGRRPEPAQPPAVAAPDAQDRAGRAQEGLQRDSVARVDAGSGQGATEAQGAARASEFAVWSHEHEAWWKPGRRGYTHTFMEAGRYSGDEAHQICYDAAYRWRRSGKDIYPPEVMIPIDSELITMGARDQEIELLGRIHVATQRTVNARREGRNYTTWICLDERHEDCPGTDSAGDGPCGCKCHGEASDG